MRPPFKLVTDRLSGDTLDCLRELTEQAEQGQVLGMAFVAMVKGRLFIRNASGECLRNPHYARGLVCALDDFLRERT